MDDRIDARMIPGDREINADAVRVRVDGWRIRNLRLDRDWTQEELAERASTTQTAISRIETGRAPVAFEVVERIAAALDVPIVFDRDETVARLLADDQTGPLPMSVARGATRKLLERERGEGRRSRRKAS